MGDIHENIEEYNPNKKHKILIVFDNMIVDMLSNKKRISIVNELFIKGRNNCTKKNRLILHSILL